MKELSICSAKELKEKDILFAYKILNLFQNTEDKDAFVIFREEIIISFKDSEDGEIQMSLIPPEHFKEIVTRLMYATLKDVETNRKERLFPAVLVYVSPQEDYCFYFEEEPKVVALPIENNKKNIFDFID